MRVPLAVSLENRADDTDKDARMVNAFAEGGGDAATGGIMRLVKRPGLDSAFTVTSGTGQALFTWNRPSVGGGAATQVLVSIVGDTINTAPTPVNKLLAFTVQPS